MKKTPLILLALPLILALKCEKNNKKRTPIDQDYSVEGLPDATTTGERTFAFLLDGQPWIANAKSFGTRPTTATDVKGKGIYYLTAFSQKRQDILDVCKISLQKSEIEVGEDYYLDDSTTIAVSVFDNVQDIYFDKERLSNLKIYKLDTTNRIIAGRFEFWYYSEKDSAYHHVTKGRFDLEID